MDALPSCQMPICLMAPIAHVMTIGQVDSLAWALCPSAQLANCSIAPTPQNFGQLCIDALPSCPNAQSVNHSRLRSPTHSQTFTLIHIRKCSPFLSRSDAFILTHSLTFTRTHWRVGLPPREDRISDSLFLPSGKR